MNFTSSRSPEERRRACYGTGRPTRGGRPDPGRLRRRAGGPAGPALGRLPAAEPGRLRGARARRDPRPPVGLPAARRGMGGRLAGRPPVRAAGPHRAAGPLPPTPPRLRAGHMSELVDAAQEFFDQLAAEKVGSAPAAERLAPVRHEIAASGSYWQTAE